MNEANAIAPVRSAAFVFVFITVLGEEESLCEEEAARRMTTFGVMACTVSAWPARG